MPVRSIFAGVCRPLFMRGTVALSEVSAVPSWPWGGNSRDPDSHRLCGCGGKRHAAVGVFGSSLACRVLWLVVELEKCVSVL